MRKYATVEELTEYSKAMEEFLLGQVLLNYEFGRRISKLEQKK